MRNGGPTKKLLRFSRQVAPRSEAIWGVECVLSARQDLGVRLSEGASEGEGPGMLDEPKREGGSSRATTDQGPGFCEEARENRSLWC